MGFDGKVAIVTGAARSLGQDYASFFAREGARVVVADIATDPACAHAEKLNADGAEAMAVTVDVADEASTLAMAEAVHERFGRIDILVNNAGVWGDLEKHRLQEIPPDYWNTVMGVNVLGPLLCSRAVVPSMRANGWGRIINISSMGAYMTAGVYGVSKLALNQLTYALANELGGDGITVNGVAPGTIANEATKNQVPDAAIERLVNTSIIKRAGTSEDIFGMIRYLASDDAGWVTAQTFLVNGGFNSRL